MPSTLTGGLESSIFQTMTVLRKIIPFIALAAALLAGTCAVNQKVLIQTDGSGTANVHIELGQAFVDYIRELAELTGEPVGDSVFDIERVWLL